MTNSSTLVILAATFALGCIPSMRLVPLQQTSTTERSIPEHERLAEWDGAAFRRVEVGSLAPTRVHVIVHGWAPGWHRDGHPPSEPAWAAEFEGRAFDPWMRELASALKQRDPAARVLVYSWLDDAATTRSPFAQRRAYSRTNAHGARMASAIEQVLVPGFREAGGNLHLIGHSFGARVASIASASLNEAPRHLTILDAPEAATISMISPRAGLAPLLRQLNIGSGSHQTFVDNYISGFGTSYRYERGLAGIVDVQTAPPSGVFEMSSRHVYAAEFYAQTAALNVGLGWSPLLSGQPPSGCWSQPYAETTLVPTCS
ncbi:MAG: hypothetical protein AB8I08_07850 [Sandaracinaceae bacterium]